MLDSRPFPTLPGCAEFEACYAETTFAATMECTNPEWLIFFFYRGSSGGAPRPGA